MTGGRRRDAQRKHPAVDFCEKTRRRPQWPNSYLASRTPRVRREIQPVQWVRRRAHEDRTVVARDFRVMP